MIVSPNSFERYLSALRVFTSLSILNHGLLPRHLENLKKIYVAEAFYHKNERQCVNLNKLCNNLLCAVSAKNPSFIFSCNINGNYIINKNLLICLLLTCAKTGELKLSALGEFLLIRPGVQSLAYPFITSLGGFVLKELKCGREIIIIPAKRTSQNSVYIESEWEYLFDKFSAVNLFF